MIRRLLLVASIATLLLGCSSDDGGTVTNDGTTTQPDGGTTTPDGSTTVPDAAQAKPLECTSVACKDFVSDRLLIPSTEADIAKYSYLHSDGKKYNQLGTILSAVAGLAGEGFTVQESVDESVNKGETLILMKVEGGDFINQATAGLQAWLAQTKECCTASDPTACRTEADTNCFSGTAEFTKDTNSPDDALFGGGISAGKGSFGPASLLISLPISGEVLDLPLKQVQLRGTFADPAAVTKIDEGVIAGLITQADLDTKVLPGVAALLTQVITEDPDSDTAKTIKGLFDTNPADGTITAAEVKGSIVGDLLAPDVDLDGDKTEDHLSLGVGFHAIQAVIASGS